MKHCRKRPLFPSHALRCPESERGATKREHGKLRSSNTSPRHTGSRGVPGALLRVVRHRDVLRVPDRLRGRPTASGERQPGPEGLRCVRGVLRIFQSVSDVVRRVHNERSVGGVTVAGERPSLRPEVQGVTVQWLFGVATLLPLHFTVAVAHARTWRVYRSA